MKAKEFLSRLDNKCRLYFKTLHIDSKLKTHELSEILEVSIASAIAEDLFLSKIHTIPPNSKAKDKAYLTWTMYEIYKIELLPPDTQVTNGS